VARRDSRELALSASAEAMFGDLSARDHFFLEQRLREAAVAHERVRPWLQPLPVKTKRSTGPRASVSRP
jgi:hypothetical protein